MLEQLLLLLLSPDTMFQLIASLFLFTIISSASVSPQPQCLLTCHSSSSYVCHNTYAILPPNPPFSSLSSLSYHFGIPSTHLALANGFPHDYDADFFSNYHLPLLIPIIHYNSTPADAFLRSFAGLTACKNSNFLVPLRCAFPPSSPSHFCNFLLSYPVTEPRMLAQLAFKFNVVSPNNSKPLLGSQPVPVPDLRTSRRKPKKMLMIGVYSIVGFVVCVAITVALFFIYSKKRRRKAEEELIKNGDLELQQLNLSIRTTSDKKMSFEGSDTTTTTAATPRKLMRMENYTLEELHKATEDFSSSNLIEGSVYHGLLKGNDLAIKRVASDTMSKMDCQVFQFQESPYPKMMRVLGTCATEGPDSYIVMEYAKNGSLKEWIHGGLAIKSHFIASCNCFLSWNERLKICIDVATALQYMHHIMNPGGYVHGNIKSRNIFLDEELRAKVGMAKSVGYNDDDDDEDEGYLAPEYLKVEEPRVSPTPSMDIFAYGVVLLEVLSGKPPIRRVEDGEILRLSDEIKQVLAADKVKEWMESGGAVGDKCSFDAVLMVANLARSCVEEHPDLRPNAAQIVQKLLTLDEQELPHHLL